MNYDVSRETISVSSLVFDGCQEIPVDLDLSLPDYCPDIQKILKCSVVPKITSRNISGDRLNIDGVINVRLIYVDSEKKSIRCCENSEPFSRSIDLRNSPENAVALTSSRVEYMNCRAINPRRIDIHGALAVCAKVYSKDNMYITSGVNGDDIQQKKSSIKVSNLTGLGQQQFSISEMLDLGQNKPLPEIIIRSDITLVFDDYKNMDNKVVVKGEALVKILYIGDINTCNMEVMEFSIPFSQVIDVPGASDNCKCTVFFEVLGHDEQIQNANPGESNLVSEDIRAAATVMTYLDQDIEVSTDVYSTDYDLECSNELVKLCRLADIIKSSYSSKSSVEFTEFNISRVIDIWSDNCSINGKYENGGIVYDGKINICVLAVDLEGLPFYIERIVDVFYKKDISADLGEDISIESNVCPIAIGYRITGSGSIEIKVDLKIFSHIYSHEKCNMIVGVNSLDSELRNKDKDCVLTIYYAKPGESVWDIARRYYTSVDAVKNENSISSDVIDQEKMLLIPM